MVRGLSRVFGIVACLCFALGASPVSAMQASGNSPGEPLAQVANQEEDDVLGEGARPNVPPSAPPAGDPLLPPEMDPDDDDDGVQDIDDIAPNDPNVGERPAPGPTDPIADDDNDGLPNIMDPDDSNDGVTDADEPREAPEPTVEAPVPTEETQDPGGGTSPAGESPAAAGPTDSVQTAPVVLALPKAGDGEDRAENAGAVLVIGSVLLLGASGLLRLRMRQE